MFGFINRKFNKQIAQGTVEWPPRSSDLTTLSSLLWGDMNSSPEAFKKQLKNSAKWSAGQLWKERMKGLIHAPIINMCPQFGSIILKTPYDLVSYFIYPYTACLVVHPVLAILSVGRRITYTVLNKT